MVSGEFEKSKIFSYKDSIEYSDGGIVSKTVIKKQTGNISLFSFDNGESLSEHVSPFDAVIQVIEGSGEILIDGNSYILKEGETIIIPANSTHAVKALNRFKMLLVMIRSN
jgi:quercetin dioxygenase-like cupin family protein